MSIEIPGYRIIKELGSGGMATVYLAVQESVNREVALKIMAPALAADRDFSERFLKEAKIVAELQHPNIVGVYDMGVYNHLNYIVMEYIDAGDLKDNLERGISTEKIFSAVFNVAEALSYAHEKGYVHRDVKSENILFRSNGTAVLSDFGIAKAVVSGTKMTGTGMSIGTPHYMSPEQARGQSLDGRADFYSLGIVLYEALAGAKPYDSEDTFAIGLMHISEPIPLLPEKLSHYQPLIDNLCAKSPEDRYSNVNELRLDFDAISSGDKFKRPDHATKLFNAQKPKRSSPLLWGVSGSIIAASLVTIMYLWQQNEKTEAILQSQFVANKKQDNEFEERQKQINELLAIADKRLNSQSFIEPFEDNASFYFKQVLDMDPNNEKAKYGLNEVAEFYISNAEDALEIKDFELALSYVESSFEVVPGNSKSALLNRSIIDALKKNVESVPLNSEVKKPVVKTPNGKFQSQQLEADIISNLIQENITDYSSELLTVEELINDKKYGPAYAKLKSLDYLVLREKDRQLKEHLKMRIESELGANNE